MLNEKLRGFTAHGLNLKIKGSQALGDCPFCGKENKLYVNPENLLWDCKTCNRKGDFSGFLGEISKIYKSKISSVQIKELARSRKLPVEAFQGLQIGFNSRNYTLPIYNEKFKCQDIRFYRIGGKLYTTPSAKVGLYQAHKLGNEKTIYLCEGEWDTIAMRYLLQKTGKPGVALGVPGANTFKEEWVSLFHNKDVRVLYDNDNAGLEGSNRVLDRLKGIASSLSFIHWPKDIEDGYDINNLISDSQKLKKTYKWIHINLSRNPERSVGIGTELKKLKPITSNELIEKYQKWLHLPNTNVLKILYGSIIANRIGGDPVWMFFVAPPGGSKSELLMSLSDCQKMKAVTSLTQHTLISGMRQPDGKDPSLLAQLDGNILIVKDFTTILTMNHLVRDEIFGTLRDAYDGSIEKVFGNGLCRVYNSKFGIVAGVTNVIETFSLIHASLGERFLKYRITGNWDLDSEREKIIRTLENIGNETKMRNELKQTAKRYLDNFIIPENMPELTDEMRNKIISLAQFTARLRGHVDRDKYTQTVNYKPSSEVGTRIAKQLMQLAVGISIFLDKYIVTEKIYDLIRQVALNSISDRTEDIIHRLYKIGKQLGTPEISMKTGLPRTTVYKVMQDLVMLNIVNNIEKKRRKTCMGIVRTN